MRRAIKNITILMAICFLVSGILPFTSMAAKAAQSNITIDGYYDDWSDKPYSWEYNWDNPWKIENYWDGTANITKEYKDENGNPYNLEIRHKMSLYNDGVNVYLHIEFATNYSARVNVDDYEIYVDGQMAMYRLTYPGGGKIFDNDKVPAPGIYQLEVRNGDSSISGTVVNGAMAIYTKKANNINNELEIKIPLTALKAQNSNINLSNYTTIEFFTPNLMYRRIACSGTSTGPYIGVGIGLAIVAGAVYWRKRKKGSQI